jgi:glutathione S-transferase
MSFVAEVARAQGSLAGFAEFNAWLDRIHSRPAWKRAIEKGGPYALGR